MLVVLGSINLDLIFPLRDLPRPGQTVAGPTLSIEPGGKGANQAVAAARDGARVAFAGAVGGDALAAGALRLMREAGIDLSRVATVAEAATGCAAIPVDAAGRNMVIVASGANAQVRAEQAEDALLGPGTTVLLQNEVPGAATAAMIRRARAAGARSVLNLAPAGPIGRDALAALDVLVANEDEAAWLAESLGIKPDPAALHAALGCTVVVTLGERGAVAATPDGPLACPGLPVAAVDTTGAGDCFVGVLAAALDRGMPLAPAMARANRAAALACTRRGTQGSLPTAAEIDAAYTNRRCR